MATELVERKKERNKGRVEENEGKKNNLWFNIIPSQRLIF
jgi:hypothetical protein